MFKVNNKNTRTTSSTSGAFIVNFEHILHVFLVILLLTLNKKMLASYLPYEKLLQNNTGRRLQ